MKTSLNLHYHLLAASAVCLLTGFGSVVQAADQPSKINLLKEDGDVPTADQQGMNKGDMEITRQIRINIVGDEHLSTYAKNIKIVTNKGHVILRGPVRSQAEIIRVLRNANAVAGASNVTNDMQIMK